MKCSKKQFSARGVMLLSPPGDWANLRTVRFARSSARPYGGHWQSRRGSLISSAHPGDMLADPPEDRATAPLVGFTGGPANLCSCTHPGCPSLFGVSSDRLQNVGAVRPGAHIGFASSQISPPVLLVSSSCGVLGSVASRSPWLLRSDLVLPHRSLPRLSMRLRPV